MPMDESDLAWGLGLLAVTAAGVLVVLSLVAAIVLLFRSLFWRLALIRRQRARAPYYPPATQPERIVHMTGLASGQMPVAEMRPPAATPATPTYSRESVWREQIPGPTRMLTPRR